MWLSGLESRQLERVLAARPDAVEPPEPRSLGELADRLQRPASVALVLPRLARPHLQMVEALAALGPAPRTALADLLGATGAEGARGLEAALGALADYALVWPDAEGLLHMAVPLQEAWDAPLGLDEPLARLLADMTSEELRRMLATLGVRPPAGTKQQRLTALVAHHSDPERVTALVAEAPAATRELLERRASDETGLPGAQAEFVVLGVPRPDSGPAARWALERGLLVKDRHGHGPALMPAEVALALRGDTWHAPFCRPCPKCVPRPSPRRTWTGRRRPRPRRSPPTPHRS